MDRYSELEVKYDASKVTVSEYWNVIDRVANSEDRRRTVVGWDTFYANPDTGVVLRYRHSRSKESDLAALTYKKRKNGGNSVDREEIDLYLASSKHTDEDAKAFVKAIGLQEHFTLCKESHIVHISCRDHIAVVALYDVLSSDGVIHRYLEIEIDKDSPCNDDQGWAALQEWKERLQEELPIGYPINKSLYELLAPRDPLYIAGTF